MFAWIKKKLEARRILKLKKIKEAKKQELRKLINEAKKVKEKQNGS